MLHIKFRNSCMANMLMKNFFLWLSDIIISPIDNPINKYRILHAMGKAILGGFKTDLFRIGYQFSMASD
jgi:hypothetical protein